MIIKDKNPQNEPGSEPEEKEVLVPLPAIVPPQFTKVLSVFFISHTLGIIAYILPKAGLRAEDQLKQAKIGRMSAKILTYSSIVSKIRRIYPDRLHYFNFLTGKIKY